MKTPGSGIREREREELILIKSVTLLIKETAALIGGELKRIEAALTHTQTHVDTCILTAL